MLLDASTVNSSSNGNVAHPYHATRPGSASNDRQAAFVLCASICSSSRRVNSGRTWPHRVRRMCDISIVRRTETPSIERQLHVNKTFNPSAITRSVQLTTVLLLPLSHLRSIRRDPQPNFESDFMFHVYMLRMMRIKSDRTSSVYSLHTVSANFG